MDRVKLSIDIKNSILDLGREYNSLLGSNLDIPKINLNEWPEINLKMNQLFSKDNSYDFAKIFTASNDSLTFRPDELEFSEDFENYLDINNDEVLIKVLTSAEREYLIFVTPAIRVGFLWELVIEEIEEVEGRLLSGTEIISIVSKNYSVNPRLLLALLEFQYNFQ